jgi:hypothetical protein
VTGDEQPRPQVARPRQALELTEADCWTLLGAASLGRVVFTHRAIVSRAAAGDGSVVGYEVDDLDPVRHTGWSVIATGMARLVRDPAAIARYEQLLEPWIAGQMDHVISMEPEFVSGIRLVVWCN